MSHRHKRTDLDSDKQTEENGIETGHATRSVETGNAYRILELGTCEQGKGNVFHEINFMKG
jgi:hypothetical protein